jgi:hypothetical protein
MKESFSSKIDKLDTAIDNRLPQSEEARRRRRNRIHKPLAVLAVGVSLFGGAKAIEHAAKAPDFSEQTHTLIAEDGEGLQSIVQRGIEGIDSIDYRDAVDYVYKMTENETTFADGILQLGEPVVVPESVER